MEAIKRKVRVTATYEVEIIFLPEFWAFYKDKGIENYIEEFLKDFRNGLWDVENIDDVAMYAAERAALTGDGQYDGIGNLAPDYSSAKADVRYNITDEDIDSEIINGDV